jgi:hypothetical protein
VSGPLPSPAAMAVSAAFRSLRADTRLLPSCLPAGPRPGIPVPSDVERELLQSGTLPIAVDPDFEHFIAGRRALLDERLAAIDAKARGGWLPDVTFERSVLKIAPIEKSTPPGVETLVARLYAMLPRIRITDLLSEVARWAMFTDCFTHLRSGETVADPRVLMASLLADGLNLGLMRMAEARTIASLGQLAWVAEWHVRDETYALALGRLVDHRQREPLAAIFGRGFASSSDGQFFRAGGFARDAGRINAHYGDDPGSKFYTHLSDRYAPFHTKVIAATASEALHILDGLLYHQSDVTVHRHHTDGGGDSDHVFALLALLGFEFAPRNPGPEEPPALQLCQAFGLSNARTANRQPYQCRAGPRPLGGNTADRRFDPDRHGHGIIDHAPAGRLSATERGGRGAARAGPAGTHVVHSQLDRGSGVAPGDEPRAQQGRVTQQLGAGCFHS